MAWALTWFSNEFMVSIDSLNFVNLFPIQRKTDNKAKYAVSTGSQSDPIRLSSTAPPLIQIWSHLVQKTKMVTASCQTPDIHKNFIRSYTIARATLSGVIGPVLTEIHKSSSPLAELFFFFVSDLAPPSPQQQQQQPLAWRQQQQWQHTTSIVKRTSRGSVRRTTRQTVL